MGELFSQIKQVDAFEPVLCDGEQSRGVPALVSFAGQGRVRERRPSWLVTSQYLRAHLLQHKLAGLTGRTASIIFP